MAVIRPLLRGAALSSLLVLLGACASKEPLVRTETVEVKVPVYVALDKKLTAVPPEPDLPAGAVTNDDVASLVDALRAWGRDMAGKLRKIEGLQPAREGVP